MAAPRLFKAAAYIGLLLLLFEGGARVFLSVQPLRRRVLGMDDASQRLRFVHRPGGQRSLYYSFDDPHPVRGWALRPNLDGISVFKGKRLHSNSRGARGQREHARPKPKGLLRILVFGDSFTSARAFPTRRRSRPASRSCCPPRRSSTSGCTATAMTRCSFT